VIDVEQHVLEAWQEAWAAKSKTDKKTIMEGKTREFRSRRPLLFEHFEHLKSSKQSFSSDG